jgi:hypothetical protein
LLTLPLDARAALPKDEARLLGPDEQPASSTAATRAHARIAA